MRLLQPRTVIVLLAVTGFALTACSTTNQTRRTTTVVATVTGSQAEGPRPARSRPTTGSGITVVVEPERFGHCTVGFGHRDRLGHRNRQHATEADHDRHRRPPHSRLRRSTPS